MTSAVCIINYNTCDLLRNCVLSVLAEGPDHVIVVDNASADGSAEMVAGEFPTVTLMSLEENIGYGPAANRAIRSTEADDILVLNADTVLQSGVLAGLGAHLSRTERPAIVGPRMLDPDGTPQTSCFHFPTPLHMLLYLSGLSRWLPGIPWLGRRSLQHLPGAAARRVPWVLGAGLAFRRSTYEELGGFDESFFMYFEEVDLCRRLWDAGGEVHYLPSVEIVHVGGASTDAHRVEMRIQYFESLARFYRKHYPEPSLTRLRLIVKALAAANILRNQILIRLGNQTRAAILSSEMAIQRSLLSGQWP